MKVRRIGFTQCIVLAALLSIAPLSAQSQANEDAKGNPILLADGTSIHLVLMDDLQGRKLQVQQIVHFKVREDLVVNSKVIVKTGIGAIGHIDSVSKSGLLGKSGKLVLLFDYVNSVSGEKIPLRGGAGVSGGTGGALTGVSALWYGPNASLPVGTIINACVNQDQHILVP
jgi:hypothetical protein